MVFPAKIPTVYIYSFLCETVEYTCDVQLHVWRFSCVIPYSKESQKRLERLQRGDYVEFVSVEESVRLHGILWDIHYEVAPTGESVKILAESVMERCVETVVW